jgi:hypothetical protein
LRDQFGHAQSNSTLKGSKGTVLFFFRSADWSFKVLNTDAKGMTKGMAHPGLFYVDESGVIREKYFEAKYTDRFTANNVISKLFPELAHEVGESVEALT